MLHILADAYFVSLNLQSSCVSAVPHNSNGYLGIILVYSLSSLQGLSQYLLIILVCNGSQKSRHHFRRQYIVIRVDGAWD